MRIKIKSDSSQWWWGRTSEKIKWAVKDKSGNWWLINNSEFPEKKIERKKNMSCGLPPTFDLKKMIFPIIIASIFGLSIGFNIIGLILFLTRS